ncbi:MAG: glycosyltransferase family 2 protein [Chloroflexota bacterium]
MITDSLLQDIFPSASIVVVSYNTSAYIVGCIESLLALDYPRVEIIVVDNASSDGSVELIRGRFPEIDLVELPDNRGFAGGASVGLFMASGEIVATVNPDVRLDPAWLREIAATLAREEVGIVGSKILYPDGKTIQHAGGVVHYPLATVDHIGRGELDNGQYDTGKAVSFVTGAALAMRRDVGQQLGFFDDEFFPVYYEDIDLCWRADKEGLSTFYQPRAVAYHEETVTLDRKGSLYYSFYHANRLRFVVKHYSPEQVMLDFLPAEAARIAGDLPEEDRKASLGLLDTMQGESMDAAGGPVRLDRKWATIQKHVDETMSGWQVYERAHAKAQQRRAKSLAGRVHNLMSRLYLWPTLQKQIEYNASLARTVRELSRQLADVQARVGVQSLLTSGLISRQSGAAAEDISLELEDLRARLEAVERKT